jgi:hypothetical protein
VGAYLAHDWLTDVPGEKGTLIISEESFRPHGFARVGPKIINSEDVQGFLRAYIGVREDGPPAAQVSVPRRWWTTGGGARPVSSRNPDGGLVRQATSAIYIACTQGKEKTHVEAEHHSRLERCRVSVDK